VPGKASFTGPTPGSHGTWKRGTYSMCHETLQQRTGRRESRRPDSLFRTARYQTSWKMIWRSRSCESTYTSVRPSFSQLRAPDLQDLHHRPHRGGWCRLWLPGRPFPRAPLPPTRQDLKRCMHRASCSRRPHQVLIRATSEHLGPARIAPRSSKAHGLHNTQDQSNQRGTHRRKNLDIPYVR